MVTHYTTLKWRHQNHHSVVRALKIMELVLQEQPQNINRNGPKPSMCLKLLIVITNKSNTTETVNISHHGTINT